MAVEGKAREVEIRAHDIEKNVATWLGSPQPQYKMRVRGKLYVLPDEQRDVVRKLTILPHVVMRVIDSPVAAVIIGRDENRTLTQRRDEDLGLGSATNDTTQIDLRLNEMIEAARQAGMSKQGLKEAERMVRKRFRHVWRTSLGPDDIAHVPPLEIEIQGDIFQLPKPYMRRYTAAEIKWWREQMAKLVENRIFRPTNSRVLSPSNLVKKILNGEVLPDDFRLVVDLRSLNKIIKDLDFPLPKLDEIIHLLKGAKCFASADNTKGYWQFPISEASKKFTGFVCPVGSYEHNRVPMGLKVAAAYYQRTIQRVLEGLLYSHILQYIDDTLIYAQSEQELLTVLEKYFKVMSE